MSSPPSPSSLNIVASKFGLLRHSGATSRVAQRKGCCNIENKMLLYK